MRVAVLAEWYPSRSDPVHGVWAHRQALAAQQAGAEVRVIATRRPVPPLSVGRRGPGAVAAWARKIPELLEPMELDGLPIATAPFLSPPRPLSYGTWGHWMSPAVSGALDSLHAQWRFDLLHAHCVIPPGFAAARWRRRHPGPALAVSTHGPDVISDFARSRFARRETTTTFATADLVIANSSWAAARCEEIAGRRLDTEIVHLGADMPPLSHQRRTRPTIVTLAHLEARKRHAVVLHALAAIEPKRRPDYLIIGDGPGREPLRQMAAELGVADRVQMTGQLDHARALKELGRCHLYVMPSVREPFGVAYVEAMAAGLPAIATRGEGGPEDIAAAGPGLVLVPRDDHRAVAAAIERELRDKSALAAHGAAARVTVSRHFTWEHCGQATVAAYERALRGAARR